MSDVTTKYFELLCTAMRKNPGVAQKVTAHVRKRTGHANLVEFYHNGATDAQRRGLLNDCLTAIKENRLHELDGEVANGQAEVEREVEEKVEVKPEPKLRVVDKKLQVPPPRIEKVEPVPVSGDKAARLLAALQEAIEAKGSEPAWDPEKLGELVMEKVVDAMEGVETTLKEIVAKYLKTVPPREVLEIVKDGGAIASVEGLTHWQLPQVITWLSAGVPLWLWGAAGAAKTTLAYQVAQALGLKPYVVACEESLTIGKLLGFRNLAVGEYVEGLLYKPYKEGGLLVLDEFDTTGPIIAGTNSLIANDQFLFPNGELVQKHKDFRVLACANTKGLGATAGYTARVRLDAATLDRFAVVELVYDESLERAIALGEAQVRTKQWQPAKHAADKAKAWVDYVQKVRKQVGNSVLVSPRASILGARALRAGIPAAEVVDALLFKLVTADTRTNLENHCGRFQ